MARAIALSLRFLALQNSSDPVEKAALGNFKPLWNSEIAMEATNFFNLIKDGKVPPSEKKILHFIHRYFVLSFTWDQICSEGAIGSAIEQTVLLMTLEPYGGWKSASKLISYLLQPLRSIAQAVLINSAFHGNFEAPYSSLQHRGILIDWARDKSKEDTEDEDNEAQDVQHQLESDTNDSDSSSLDEDKKDATLETSNSKGRYLYSNGFILATYGIIKNLGHEIIDWDACDAFHNGNGNNTEAKGIIE
jgi:hypothetical protein